MTSYLEGCGKRHNTTPIESITAVDCQQGRSRALNCKYLDPNSESSSPEDHATPSNTVAMWYSPNVELGCGQRLYFASGINSYDWGKVGSESAAAKFAAATPSDDLHIEQEKPYAEVRTSRGVPMSLGTEEK